MTGRWLEIGLLESNLSDVIVVAALILAAAGSAGAGPFLHIRAGSLGVLSCPCPRCSGYKKLVTPKDLKGLTDLT